MQICSIHHAILIVLFKIIVCPSRVPLTEHNLRRIRATNTSRLANMSRPSSATQKPSAYVPKNRKETCPPSTRIELQPMSSRFVCQIIICCNITKFYTSEWLLFVRFLFQMKWTEVIQDCSQAVELNPCYVKALFRRAKALEKLDKKRECLEG